MGITRKSFISLSATIPLITIFFLGILYFTLPIYYNQSKKEELHQDFNQVAHQINHKSQTDIIKQLKILDEKHFRIFFSLSDTEGNLIYPILEYPDSLDSIDSQTLSDVESDEVGLWTANLVTDEGKLLFLSGEYSFPSLTTISQTLLTMYPFVILLFIMIVGIAVLIYSRLSTKRIKEISLQTRQMQRLEKGLTCQVSGQDEIAHLSQDINSLYNHLLTSIEHLEYENQKTLLREKQKMDFLRMTSHELKTPITSMTGMIEGMLYNVGDFKNRDKYLKLCYQILKEQGQIVQSILEASKLDLILKPYQDTFSLEKLLMETLPIYEGIAAVKHLQFDVHLEPCTISAHQLYLDKAIKNILDNAFRYTRSGGKVTLTLTHGKLSIANQAEHVLEDDQLEQVFQPFYRPDFSRNRQDGGTGLGLYIVEQILSKHRLSYHFEQQDDYMVFTIDFNNLINTQNTTEPKSHPNM
ncbi:sensor histidine kinase [Streptococcus sp. S784/96/1]|uniref:sensor histidine kinase n=1 Tax=Streptococcus sp. S784/96/1 TaxID=2653499 RepID=UPI00138A3ADC|nr:HAMP domain-containing sensor histidine kinase [Streptococcus sp. S784/96/1]